MSGRVKFPKVNRAGIAVQLAALSALGPFCIDAYLPSMNDIAQKLGTTLTAVQGTLTAYMIPFALMTLWHGAVSDALGRRRVVLYGLGSFALASIGCACAPSLGWLLFFRVLQGACAGVGMVVGRAIVRDLYDGPSAQKLMAMVAMVFAIAPAVAPVIGGWLQHWFGSRAVFVFMGVYAISILGYCFAKLPETLPPKKRQSLAPSYLAKSYLRVLTHPQFLVLCLTLTVAFAGLFLYVLSAPVFLMQHLHLSETGFIWLFGPMTTGIMLGNAISARMAGVIPPMRMVGYGCGIMLASAVTNTIATAIHPPMLPWAVIPTFFYMLGMSLNVPALTLKAMDYFPQQRGMAASCQSFIQSIGNAITSVVTPLIWATSLRLALSQLACALFATTLAILIVRRRCHANELKSERS